MSNFLKEILTENNQKLSEIKNKINNLENDSESSNVSKGFGNIIFNFINDKVVEFSVTNLALPLSESEDIFAPYKATCITSDQTIVSVPGKNDLLAEYGKPFLIIVYSGTTIDNLSALNELINIEGDITILDCKDASFFSAFDPDSNRYIPENTFLLGCLKNGNAILTFDSVPNQ